MNLGPKCPFSWAQRPLLTLTKKVIVGYRRSYMKKLIRWISLAVMLLVGFNYAFSLTPPVNPFKKLPKTLRPKVTKPKVEKATKPKRGKTETPKTAGKRVGVPSGVEGRAGSPGGFSAQQALQRATAVAKREHDRIQAREQSYVENFFTQEGEVFPNSIANPLMTREERLIAAQIINDLADSFFEKYGRFPSRFGRETIDEIPESYIAAEIELIPIPWREMLDAGSAYGELVEDAAIMLEGFIRETGARPLDYRYLEKLTKEQQYERRLAGRVQNALQSGDPATEEYQLLKKLHDYASTLPTRNKEASYRHINAKNRVQDAYDRAYDRAIQEEENFITSLEKKEMYGNLRDEFEEEAKTRELAAEREKLDEIAAKHDQLDQQRPELPDEETEALHNKQLTRKIKKSEKMLEEFNMDPYTIAPHLKEYYTINPDSSIVSQRKVERNLRMWIEYFLDKYGRLPSEKGKLDMGGVSESYIALQMKGTQPWYKILADGGKKGISIHFYGIEELYQTLTQYIMETECGLRDDISIYTTVDLTFDELAEYILRKRILDKLYWSDDSRLQKLFKYSETLPKRSSKPITKIASNESVPSQEKVDVQGQQPSETASRANVPFEEKVGVPEQQRVTEPETPQDPSTQGDTFPEKPNYRRPTHW